ncbi:site-specific DNA-methyltransferase [Candidatus Nomurabacteria bacterium]|nr:site-specific DNA-methyltransferase [Candidatus Nomurabacteria bacterium]
MSKYDKYSKEELLALVEKQDNELASKKYGLVWDSEREPEQVVLDCEHNVPVLKRVKGKEIKTSLDQEDNILIEGDNYHALTVLNYTHQEKIDVIYIDPPYNTENKDFIYNDSFVNKEDGFRHSKWLNFMDKRLKLAKQLLKPNGLIAVSIDDNEFAHLKLLLDGLFDEKTKVVVVKMSEASGLKMGAVKKAGIIPKYKEYLILAKQNGVNGLYFDYIKKAKWDEEYNIFVDNFSQTDRDNLNEYFENEELKETDLKTIDKDLLKKIKLTPVNEKLKELKISKIEDVLEWKYQNAWRIIRTAASSSVKKLADKKRKTINQAIISVLSNRDKLLYLVKNDYDLKSKQPRVQIIFADNNLLMHPGDLWVDIKTTGLDSEGGVNFKNGKKPLEFIKRIIKTCSNKDAVILDFFAGSGTTGHAVLDLNKLDSGNRKFILCTYNEENGTQVKIAEEYCYPRIFNCINGNKNVKKLGGNLQYFKTELIKKTDNKDQARFDLTQKCTEMLCLKENIFNLEKEKEDYKIFSSNKKDKFLCVYYNLYDESFCEFVKEIKKLKGKKQIYVFSIDGKVDKDLFKGVNDFEVEEIPQKIIDIYKQLVKMNIPVKANTIFLDFEKAQKKVFVEKDKDESARILRIVLEKTIQKIAQKNRISIFKENNKEEKIAILNDNLYNSKVLKKIQWEENKSYLAIGNHASHGEYDEYNLNQIESFYKYVQFLFNDFGM